MSEVPKWVVCVRLAMSESLSRRHLPLAEGRWLHRGGRRAATNGPLSPVHALECERGEGCRSGSRSEVGCGSTTDRASG